MFKKRESVDILDIPELSRRKLIKLPEPETTEKTIITRDGFFDLSNQQTNSSISSQSQPEQNNQGVTDFLSDFASIGASQPQTNSQIEARAESSDSIKDLKWRIENLEFKLEQLIERLNSMNK